MLPTIERPGVCGAPTRPVALKVVRITDPAGGGRWISQRPTWWAVYGIAFLTVGAVFAAEAVLPEGLVQTLSLLAAMSSGVALIRLWIGCNRWRLVREAKQATAATVGACDEVSSIQEVA